jgi:hypothetical protein
VLRARVRDEVLAVMLADNVKTRVLQPDGSYVQQHPDEGETPLRSQQRFMDVATNQALQHQVEPKLRLRPSVVMRPPGRRDTAVTAPRREPTGELPAVEVSAELGLLSPPAPTAAPLPVPVEASRPEVAPPAPGRTPDLFGPRS